MTLKLSESLAVNRFGQELLNDVFRLFIDLVVAGGANAQMIGDAFAAASTSIVESKSGTIFKELGALQRDCMEVMCTWRRDARLVDQDGEPVALDCGLGPTSFETLCKRAGCTHDTDAILRALQDFGAVSIASDGKIKSETPTFLLGRASGGMLASDGLLKQLEGYLRVVHRNASSVAGPDDPRFERACTVSVAVELEPVFDRLVRSRGQEFVDSIDEWLERNAKHESASGRYRELGAGAYYIDLGERAARTRKG